MEKTSEEKAFEFWMKRIAESKKEYFMYKAGVEWMVWYWKEKLDEITNK